MWCGLWLQAIAGLYTKFWMNACHGADTGRVRQTQLTLQETQRGFCIDRHKGPKNFSIQLLTSHQKQLLERNCTNQMCFRKDVKVIMCVQRESRELKSPYKSLGVAASAAHSAIT